MTLIEYLDRHGISADAFARKIRVSFSSVYKYRVGTRTPRAKIKARIQKATKNAVTFKKG